MRKVTEIIVNRYSKISVQDICILIKDVDENMIYYHDYTDKQAPYRDYIFSVLTIMRYMQLKGIVENNCKKRTKDNKLPER